AGEAAVDLARGEDKAPTFGQRDDLFHQLFAGDGHCSGAPSRAGIGFDLMRASPLRGEVLSRCSRGTVIFSRPLRPFGPPPHFVGRILSSSGAGTVAISVCGPGGVPAGWSGLPRSLRSGGRPASVFCTLRCRRSPSAAVP